MLAIQAKAKVQATLDQPIFYLLSKRNCLIRKQNFFDLFAKLR